jgi:hypothetical protein
MKIKFCVPTCKAHSASTLDVIIPSLISSGIDPHDIIAVEGGNEVREYINNKYNIQYIKTNHNSFDYTALIDVVENEIEADFVFNIHDTCKAGSQFFNLVKTANFNLLKTALYHNNINGASMAMGLINYQYLLRHKELIQSFKNEDYSHHGLKQAKYKAVQIEDSIFWGLADTECGEYARGSDSETLRTETPYGTETPRIVEYYKPIDLYKYKANWGQTADFIYDL